MNVLYAIAFKFTDLLKPFIVVPLFLSFYGTQAYGLFTQIILIVTLFYILIDLGIGYSSQRFFHDKTDGNKKILSNILAIELFVGFFALLIIYELFQNSSWVYTLVFGDIENPTLIISVLIYIILFALTTTLIGISRAFGEFKKLVITKVIVDIIEVVMLSILIINTQTFDERYMFILIFSKMILLSILIYFVNIKPSFRDIEQNQKRIEDFFKYSLLVIPTAFIGFANSSSDRFFISHFFGLDNVGIYSVIYQYIAYITLIAFPFTFGYFATMSKYYEEKEYLNFRNLVKKIIYIVIFSTLFTIFIVYFLQDFIYETFLGLQIDRAFREVIIYTLITVFFLNLISIQTMVFNVLKKNGLIIKLLSVTAILNIILNSLFMKEYGYSYAAISTMISTILLFSMQIFYLKKHKGLIYVN